MDDITIRLLLSRFVKQSLKYTRAEAIDDDSFSDAVASAAWNSLIYLLRQSFVQQDRICLQQVGEFVKESGEWKFNPAASLAEADAFRLPAKHGRKRLAQLALFHLDQAIELAQSVPTDVDNPRDAEPWKDTPILDVNVTDQTLASELRRLSLDLFRMSGQLGSKKFFDVTLTEGAPKTLGIYEQLRQLQRDTEQVLGNVKRPGAPESIRAGQSFDFDVVEVPEPAAPDPKEAAAADSDLELFNE